MIRRGRVLLGAMGLVLALAYLRDPPWLASVESGVGPSEVDAAGRRTRWTGGRASFFVPADAVEVRIPFRSRFATSTWPVVVSITVDDRPVDYLTLIDTEWRESQFPLPAAGSRRVRRIDIHVNRTAPDGRGVQLGETSISR